MEGIANYLASKNIGWTIIIGQIIIIYTIFLFVQRRVETKRKKKL